MTPTMLEVDIHRAPGADHGIVTVSGVVDLTTREVLDAGFAEACVGCRSVITDLRAVRFFAAAGVHCLLRARNRLTEQGGALRLVCTDDWPVLAVLRAVRLLGNFPIHKDVDAAVRALV